MTAAEVAANPFLSKENTFTFTTITDECGQTVTEVRVINQTNKALTVNGSTQSSAKLYTANALNESVKVKSNAKWKLSITASGTSAVELLTPAADLNVTKGTELENGQADIEASIGYKVTVGSGLSRYNYLTFSDNESPKRFNDVALTVSQCSGTEDLTMVQYKDLWEQLYGLNPSIDEPDSDGDITKNTNKVQWHYDQDGNIFFSAMFGTERWMITNLAAASYASGFSGTKPTLIQTYADSYTAAHYGYPNPTGSTNAADATTYNSRQRLGRLYNWFAATGNQNTSIVDQSNINPTPQVQGIYPDTWHLPGDGEWNDLMTTLESNPTKYSTNTIGVNTAETVKELCEATFGTGKSLAVLDGGFNILLAGYAKVNHTTSLGNIGTFWSASSMNDFAAWFRYIIVGNSSVIQHRVARYEMYSVRCKK